MKFFKTLSAIILPILIVASAAVMVLLVLQYKKDLGSIEGTGFKSQELEGVGGVDFDVDDDGNLYFADTEPLFNAGIVIYDDQGKYLYTLPIKTSGAIGVIIDHSNHILVCDAREETITVYDQKGNYLRSYKNDYSYSHDQFFRMSSDNVRERNGIRYINNGGTITKVENGVETVVFRVPAWQQWYRAFQLILIFSSIGLAFRIAAPIWLKEYKESRKQDRARMGKGLS